jgi:hypothetical protein
MNHVYANLRKLSEAAKTLEEQWEKVEHGSREALWWEVHKASRDVWNILHPPKPPRERKVEFKGGTL